MSVIGVKGWFSANWRRPAGMESTGTKPLPKNGRRIRNIGMLLAVSTLLASRPNATESQMSAKASSTSSPTAASQRRGSAGEWKPISSATAITTRG